MVMGFGKEDHRVKMPFSSHHICFHDIWVLINFIPHLLNLLTTGKENITLLLNNYFLASLEEDLSYYVILLLHFPHLAFKHMFRGTFIANEGESTSDWDHFICFYLIRYQCFWNIFASEHDSTLSIIFIVIFLLKLFPVTLIKLIHHLTFLWCS